jgi:hypothetical protein
MPAGVRRLARRSWPLAAAVLAVAASPAVAGSSWSSPHALSNCGAAPRGTLARDGTATVVYFVTADCGTEGSSVSRVRTSREVGRSWSAPLPAALSPEDVGPQPAGSPTARTAAGELLTAWASAGAVRVAAFRPATGWRPASPIAERQDLRGEPTVAVGDSGDAVVSWAREVSRGAVVEAATRSPDGRWSAPAVISGRPGSITAPVVTVDVTGRATATWRNVAGTGRNPFVSVLTASRQRGAAGWTAPERLARAPGIGPVHAGVDGAGTVVLAWWRGDGTILTRARSAGGPWGPVRPVDGSYGPVADMAIGSLGDIVLSSGTTGSGARFTLLTRAPGAEWQGEAVDSSLSAGAVLVNGAGDALAFAEADESNTSRQRFVVTHDARLDHPAIRELRVLGAGRPASSMRIRLALSAPGRVLLTLGGSSGRTTLAAAVVRGGPTPADLRLPARLVEAMSRPGAYRLTADTGARDAALGRRATTLRPGVAPVASGADQELLTGP